MRELPAPKVIRSVQGRKELRAVTCDLAIDPAITEESLEIAVRYAELNPRRGRPRQAPWQAQEPTHVFRPEDLRGDNG
jgi:hypothetical protein